MWRYALGLAIFCTLANALLSYVVLEPAYGFDDANITMNYAENIANGHGYVYVIGGERVEGSTSPLWTAINALGYLLPVNIAVWLSALGFVIAVATVWASMRLGALIFEEAGLPGPAAYLPVFTGFLILPTYFGWTVWSLMDFGLWVLWTTLAFWFLARLIRDETPKVSAYGLAVVAALLAVTRPEGIAVVLAFGVLLMLFSVVPPRRSLRVPALLVIGSGIAAFAVVAAARLIYFGDVFPNTYYSKVSTNRTAVVYQGLVYARGFLTSPLNLTFAMLALIAPLPVWRSRGRPMGSFLSLWLALMLGIGGGIALYVAMGGDHFGSFRFFLFVYPVLIPLAGLTLVSVWRLVPTGRGTRLVPPVAGLALVALTWGLFADNKGGYVHEFRIAETGREMGRILNDYPGRPAIAIVAAGGISMTYEGYIYDLMGLNWVEMARSNREKVAPYVNHGGFSREVFYRTLPDIVHPEPAACDKERFDTHPFYSRILDDLFRDAEFQDLYAFECWEGLVFYRRRDLQPGV